LQSIFANPAPVKPFRRVGKGGTQLEVPDFPERNSLALPRGDPSLKFFREDIHRLEYLGPLPVRANSSPAEDRGAKLERNGCRTPKVPN
jgi:hypothetical protein